MYNFVFKDKQKQYTDDYYSDSIEAGISILEKYKYELISVGYVYKFLYMYWKIDLCAMSHGQYQTLKQLSLNWFKNAQIN